MPSDFRIVPRPRRQPAWPAWAAALVAVSCLAIAPVTTEPADELFDPSVLHDIHLSMKVDDWTTLRARYHWDDYYPADFQWRDTRVPIVGIRSRGAGSRSGRKPGLKIDFNRYVEDQTAFGRKSLVLANATQDPAMLKQRLAFAIFAKMNMPAPRAVHARLFVNGEYIGLYELIEPLDKAFLARVFGADAEGKAKDDGYLYEYHWKDGYTWDYLGRELRIYEELFEAKTNEKQAPSILYGPLEELFRTFNDVRDRQFESEVGRLLDLRQFVQHLAVENFIAEYDGFLGNWGPNNFYLYRFEDGRPAQFLPWDKDSAFWGWDYDIFQGLSDNVLATRALQVPALYRTYFETLQACAAAAMAPASPDSAMSWLETEMRQMTAQIHAAGYLDGNKPFNNARFDDELEKVLRFSRERGPFVSREATKVLAK